MAVRAEAEGATVDDITWAFPYLPIDPKRMAVRTRP